VDILFFTKFQKLDAVQGNKKKNSRAVLTRTVSEFLFAVDAVMRQFMEFYNSQFEIN
jgi:hypothetical protein